MRITRSFKDAWNGLKTAVAEERNMKVHLMASVLVIVLGFYFSITTIEWILIVISMGLVIGAELINTALENLTNLVTMEKKPLAGKVKDIAAAAVLFMSVLSVIIGLIIFTKYFKLLFE